MALHFYSSFVIVHVLLLLFSFPFRYLARNLISLIVSVQHDHSNAQGVRK